MRTLKLLAENVAVQRHVTKNELNMIELWSIEKDSRTCIRKLWISTQAT